MEEHFLQMALRAKEYRNGDESWISPEQYELEKADEMTELFHYTNLESMLKILAGRYLRFSRIDILNDPLEKKPLEPIELYKRVFIASFTKEKEESIPLWKIYTTKGMGIRMDFHFKSDSIWSHFIDYSRDILDANNNILNQKNSQFDSSR